VLDGARRPEALVRAQLDGLAVAPIDQQPSFEERQRREDRPELDVVVHRRIAQDSSGCRSVRRSVIGAAMSPKRR
jgi:hypothetical protein